MKKMFDKKIIYGVIIGGVLFGSIGVLATNYLYKSDQISYTSNKTDKTNVEEALDELYRLSNSEKNYEQGFDEGKKSVLESLYGASTTKNVLSDYSISARISGGDNRWARTSKSGQYSKIINLYKNDSGEDGILNLFNMVISIETSSTPAGSATDSTGTKGYASASYSINTDTGVVLTSGSLNSGSKTITLNLFDYNLGEGATKINVVVDCSVSADLAGSTISYRSASGTVNIKNVYVSYLNA